MMTGPEVVLFLANTAMITEIKRIEAVSLTSILSISVIQLFL